MNVPERETKSWKFPSRSNSSHSLLSSLLILWLDPLLFKGYRKELKHEDLYAIPSTVASHRLLRKFNRYWEKELERKKNGHQPRLLVALVKCLWWRLLLHGLFFGLEITTLFSQSLVTGYLAEFFRNKQVLEEDLNYLLSQNETLSVQAKQQEIDESVRNGYLYAMALVPLSFAFAISRAHTFFLANRMGMMCRIMTTGAIYQKVLKLSHTTIGKLSSGHIVNLASNDVQRFDLAFLFIHELWVVIVFFPIITYLLWREIGLACFTAVSVPLILFTVQYSFSRLYAFLRAQSAKITDRRIQVMTEIVTGIRVIKMYAWEHAVKKYVQQIRKKESFMITKAAMIRIGNYASFAFTTVFLSFIAFSTFAGTGGEMEPRTVFTTLGFLTYMRLYFVLFLILCLFSLSEASVAIKRIQKLLLLPELERPDNKLDCFIAKSSVAMRNDITLTTLEYSNKHTSLDIFCDNSIAISHDKTVYSSSRVVVDNLSASWTLEPDKLVLNNINFHVDQSCRLLVIVGSVGAGKSSLLHCLLGELEPLEGGIRINGTLSYASQESWIFSGTIKDNILFGRPLNEAWYNCVVDACSLRKDIDDMPYGDETLVGERGVTLSGGQKARINLARAVYYDTDIYLLDDPLSAVDANVSRRLFEDCITGLLRHKLVILVTHKLHYARQANSVLVIREGVVQDYGTFDEIISHGLDPSELLKNEKEQNHVTSPTLDRLTSIISDRLTVETPTGEEGSTVDLRDVQATGDLSIHHIESIQELDKETVHNALPEEDKAQGKISMLTYIRYYKTGGGILLCTLLILVYLITESNIVAADWWLSEWARTSDSCSLINSTLSERFCEYDLTANQRIAIYGAIITSAIIFSFIRGYLYLLVVLRASRKLHNKMFAAILRAPVYFFDTNPVGRVINRFSKDIGFLDDLLPFESYQYTTLQLRTIAIFIVAVVANPWVVIPGICTLVSLVLFRQYFVVPSRNIKRLEALARSPLYSHISASLQGLTTIRAFGKESSFLDQFHHYQNEHSKGWYLYVATSRWFGMRIDFFAATYLTIVSFVAVPLASSLDPALVGLSLVYTVSLIGLFQYVIILSTEVEGLVEGVGLTFMGHYMALAVDITDGCGLSSKVHHDLLLKKSKMVSTERIMSYGRLQSEGPLDTSLVNKKPSISWPDQGCIRLEHLQFRYAADLPYVLNSITCDIKSYEKIQLRKLIEGLGGKLKAEVSESGSNFSVGERQLVCLARALLRKNKVLVIDEATANVDQSTDEIIQKTIREQFLNCTILTIAHRLNTIMDSDRVLVLQSGKIIEFDEPYLLLRNSSSYFAALVAQTGTVESEKLTEMARRHYLFRKNNEIMNYTSV